MPAKLLKISYPVPSNKKGDTFTSVESLLSLLGDETSGQFLVGSQGMWHGGIHISDAKVPWCALSANTAAETQYRPEAYKGEQFIRCMADGEIVAYRVCKDYESTAIDWRDDKVNFSTSFVLVKHYTQPGDNPDSGLTFHTLYMNMAPFSAYGQQGDARERTTTDGLSYYTSAEEVRAGHRSGSLPVGTRVKLGDKTISHKVNSVNRQFSEVNVIDATAGLSAGTVIWILSDKGNLKSGPSVLTPSWWGRCAPAYGTQHAGMVSCTATKNWGYYLSSEDVLLWKRAGALTPGFPLSYEQGNTAQQVIRPGKEPTDSPNTFSLVTLGQDLGGNSKLNKGDRVWVVSDGDSLTAVTTTGGEPKFGEVVQASIQINAGDGIGHMGFYELPNENGKRSRYQVHIECLAMGNVEKFITNPGRVDIEDKAAFLMYPGGVPLFTKNAQGQLAESSLKTKNQGIATRSKVAMLGAEGQAVAAGAEPAYYQINQEQGWLAAANVEKVSRYDLGKLGFVTLNKVPESFDLLDGVKHPDNVVKGILEQMYKAAQVETRTSHALNEYNYKRLLEQIDSNHDGYYSEQEYLQAVHNGSYRDHLYRIIAKHGSEWYYGIDDPLWKTYLDKLATDAPSWKTYTEEFIKKIAWMKQVPGMGPDPWHLHPVVFMDALSNNNAVIIFPLQVKPENDPGKKWGNTHSWRAERMVNAATMDYPRERGRKHAARDLYTNPYTPVVAICPGTVLEVRNFYNRTHQITVHHKATDGREFIARYGEVNPTTIKVNSGDEVVQGQQLGETGALISTDDNGLTRPTFKLNGTIVFMLHFELFSGAEGFTLAKSLTDVNESHYKRRGDLLDPVQLLVEGYNNTFSNQTSQNQEPRQDVNTLVTSEKGRLFIKDWEQLELTAYNDAHNYCTIGYGHLIDKLKCEDIILPDEFKSSITIEKANEVFNIDILKFENAVKNAVAVKLYQYEFDALVSLLFNCGENFFFLRKAPNLIDNVNREKYDMAANELLDITNNGDNGLVKRRSAENNMFLNNVYNSVH
ncbi:GH24 family phage-related lysozyme (muramidase) [Buttiauxella sp. JUb87]|uniref:glycoside hydrolase family protein n=1 Tax=Buttiauxella sp. JUb87 TaxID=2485129 RepID=UPI00105C6303|nr:glycoside hydrolase family protein [Buttiauxella sp. JUb87]TDN50097.1 GH24 family phage-related lysozyme (muramidase) [Buttiauxella sp. JUb87]